MSQCQIQPKGLGSQRVTKDVQLHLKDLQSKWYQILKDEGFEDIEDHLIGGFETMENGQTAQAIDGARPLRSWSGVSAESIDPETGDLINIIDLYIVQEPLEEMQSTFPEPLFTQEQALLNCEDFIKICETICSHGNHTLSVNQVKQMWELYLDGGTNRSIAAAMGINDSLVFRTVKALSQWAMLSIELMDD
jgi:hypothetical protein